MKKFLPKVLFCVTFPILVGIFAMYMLSCVGFLLHVGINIYYPITALAISIISAIFISKLQNLQIKELLITLFVFFGVIIISLLFGYFTLDYSWDGITYHQEAIILLKEGYNPVFDNINQFAENIFRTPLYWNLVWVENYTKFVEICQANIFALTGNIESGKMLNFISGFMLFGYSFYVLNKSLLKNKNLFLQLLISFIFIINPVVISQFMTYCTDFFVYVYFIMLLFGIIDLEVSEYKNILPYVIICMSSSCLINVKLGGILYTVVPLLSYFIYLLCLKNRNKLKSLGITCLIILLCGIISGVNPYYTNIKNERHVLYPLQGKGKAPIIKNNTPISFTKKSPAYNFLSSTFSRVDNFQLEDQKKRHHIKMPFYVYKDELNIVAGADTRICGFGVFWSGILLISLILAIKIKFNKEDFSLLIAPKIKSDTEQYNKTAVLLFSILLMLLFVNPYAWWARYCPHLWTIPIFIIIYRLNSRALKLKTKICIYFLLFVMLLNSGIQTFYVLQYECANRKKVNEMCNKIQRATKPLKVYGMFEVGFFEQLKERNIPFEIVSEDYYKNHKDSFKDKSVYTYWNYEEITSAK